MAMDFITSWQLWFWTAITLFLFFVFETIIIIIWARKTHAVVEFRAWRRGIPISLFFQDSGYMEMIAVPPEAGIIQDENYGTYIINEQGTYIDRRTKNIMIPFDASVATSINVSAAKLADDLKYIIKDERQMAVLRQAIMTGQIEESETVEVLRTSVQFSAIKGMLNAMIPHAISAKIEKMIAARLKGVAKINVPQLLLIFCVILGAVILGAIILKSVLNNPPQIAQTAANLVQTIPQAAVVTTPFIQPASTPEPVDKNDIVG